VVNFKMHFCCSETATKDPQPICDSNETDPNRRFFHAKFQKPRKITVWILHNAGPKGSRVGQYGFRYIAAAMQERWFTVMVVCMGALSVAMTMAALFWH